MIPNRADEIKGELEQVRDRLRLPDDEHAKMLEWFREGAAVHAKWKAEEDEWERFCAGSQWELP